MRGFPAPDRIPGAGGPPGGAPPQPLTAAPFPFPKEVRSRARRAGRPRTLHPALVPAGGTCP